jgi:hypothetical protein
MSAFDSNALNQQSEKMSAKVSNYAEQATDKVSQIRDRVQSDLKRVGRRLRNVDETTIPDGFRGVPKYISPRLHSWLDFAVSTYFLGLGVWFALHGKGRAATAAFINGAMVGGVSALTDYHGDGRKPISFKMHGTFDAVQAAQAALDPIVYGFGDQPEAKYFWGQAIKEVAVIATTDWDAGMPGWLRPNAAREQRPISWEQAK